MNREYKEFECDLSDYKAVGIVRGWLEAESELEYEEAHEWVEYHRIDVNKYE